MWVVSRKWVALSIIPNIEVDLGINLSKFSDRVQLIISSCSKIF